MDEWKEELGLPIGTSSRVLDSSRSLKMSYREIELRKRVARYEDLGHGACWLRDARVGEIVENALLHFDQERYLLLAWCIMPNHVHVMVETREQFPLGTIVQSWKTFTAKAANKVLSRDGEFWQRDYYDRYVRHAEHFTKAIRYIEDNPVVAGLVTTAEAWPFSSARWRRR